MNKPFKTYLGGKEGAGMKKRYLVIWQLGNNEQSKHETAVDVIVNEVNTAKEVYQRIVKAVEKETTFDNINILGVYSL